MNDQLKLTLASGVVHGLKCRLKHDTKSIFKITAFDFLKNTVTLSSDLGHVYGTWSIDDIELLMHPVSKLTEAILPDGKIPIVELANKKYGENNFDPDLVMEELELSGWHNWPTWITDQLDAWHINYKGVEAVEI